ncbi:peroxiredoxin [Wenzhouxiangella sp. EGI_FJ10305]|uniref:peroxiredoxin n=1 Tax=Wenzhouxiangella sp. EGI_FJ10305 TaxID=3243768 RepID=UPI0035D729CC
MTIRTGDAAPDFSLSDQDDGQFTLSEHLGKRLLLVFYPGDDTPVCTRQLCDYRDGIEQFADLDVQVVGISGDDAASHRRFRDKHDLPFTLLSDPGLEVAAHYGCKGLMGMKRGVFLVDEDGVVRYAHVESVAVFRRSREELIEVIRHLE